MPNETFGLNRIMQLSMSVSNLEIVTAFYRDVLNVPFLFGFSNLSFFDCDGVRFMLTSESPTQKNSVIYFQAQDIHITHKTLQDRGVVFDDEPHIVHQTDTYELWMAFFKDPEGNLLAIASEITK